MRDVDNFWDSLDFFNNTDIFACAFGRVEAAERSDWEYMNFSAPFNKLYFIKSGSLTAEIIDETGSAEKRFVLTPGRVYLIPCANRYNLYTETGFVKYFIHINIMLKDGYDIFSGVRDILSAPFDAEIFDAMLPKLVKNEFFSTLKAKSIAYDALVKIIGNYDSELLEARFNTIAGYPPILLDAIKLVGASLDAKLTVEFIAKECGVTGQCLSKKFTRNLGITPKKYLEAKLSERAGILLLSTSMTIKEISEDLKFNDQYSFSKFFKKAMGCSPSKYRVFRMSIDSKK